MCVCVCVCVCLCLCLCVCVFVFVDCVSSIAFLISVGLEESGQAASSIEESLHSVRASRQHGSALGEVARCTKIINPGSDEAKS